jgi:lambda family phage portal protein
MELSSIVDASGRPFALPSGRGARADGSNGPDGTTTLSGMPSAAFPYDASSWSTQEMGNWLPVIRSPDAEINQFRDRMVARSRDLERNNGWATGGVTRILDNVVGTHLRLSSIPDYRALALRFGIKAFDATWATEFQGAAEALWRNYSESLGRWSDVTRMLTMGQKFRLALRHKLIDGESLALAYWMPERVGYAGADYATAFLLVDPDRLSNPYQKMDDKNLRGGVEIDDDGVPIGYHIRKAQQNDWYNAIEANTWERVAREDDDGWRRVFHDYDHNRAGQHRGLGVFTSVLNHMKMLARYYGVELQAATIAATFGTYVTSPYDPALVQDALGADDDSELPLYQDLRAKWNEQRPAMLNGARIPTLAPGESIESVSSDHPHGNFTAFAHEMLCVFASATGISVEQVTQDWSRTNYSSARAALMETWKTLMRRRHEFTTNTATPMYGLWLQEAMELGQLPLPMGAPSYVEAATSYSRAKWLGPARGWIDPTKEPAGAVLRMEAGISTLEQEAAEQGADWEEIADQRAIEMKAYEERGLPPPKWAAIQGAGGEGGFFKDDEESKAQKP